MTESAPWLVVGLGNPGPQYETTRHNVGHLVVDEMCERAGVRLSATTMQASTASVRIGGVGVDKPRAILAKLTCFMNVSGGPLKALAKYYEIPLERIIVIHDELDIDAGSIRLKHGGGEGGHNGLRSITKSLSSREYLRVRVGIGRPPGRMPVADYVLRPFSVAETKQLPFILSDAADAAEFLITLGLVDAQQRVHAPR